MLVGFACAQGCARGVAVVWTRVCRSRECEREAFRMPRYASTMLNERLWGRSPFFQPSVTDDDVPEIVPLSAFWRGCRMVGGLAVSSSCSYSAAFAALRAGPRLRKRAIARPRDRIRPREDHPERRSPTPGRLVPMATKEEGPNRDGEVRQFSLWLRPKGARCQIPSARARDAIF